MRIFYALIYNRKYFFEENNRKYLEHILVILLFFNLFMPYCDHQSTKTQLFEMSYSC
jgi:hypothetical protein